MEIVKVTPHVTALVTPVPIPGLGVLPINAFVIKTAGGVILVDTCLTQPAGEFLAGVGGVIDPTDIKWIWLTHPDRDHTGGLLEILDAAPDARLMTSFASIGHIGCGPEPVPPDRVHLVTPGEQHLLGDTQVIAFRPPLYDNPGTVGFFEPTTRTLVTSDCFGAPQSSMQDALVPDVAVVPDEQITMGQMMWGSTDSPWVHSVDPGRFAVSLNEVRTFDPVLTLGTHIPPIHGDISKHLDTLSKLPDSPPAPGLDQASLEALLAEMQPPSE
ncbi:MAG TPA: MBL fold metallo-hydrolase [Actinomycetota bacterium]|nr:MBL fold metallo-hydrolase [Actinomycetota bacterium]